MDGENDLDFNFWPAFSDLMLTLVLIMITVLFSFNAVFTLNRVKPEVIDGEKLILKPIRENQARIIESIAKKYNTRSTEFEPNHYGISLSDRKDIYDIIIRNDPTVQQITFSDHILFEPDSYRLNEAGQSALEGVGTALKQQIGNIQEIQIQGHADPDPTGMFSSNLELAARRAIEVYMFFKETSNIDPSRHMMSATSFGEFRPVERSVEDMEYNFERLMLDNDNEEKKSRNRRIELLLFYKD